MARGFEICKGYEQKNINLPKRQTKYAVGYDIEAAEDTFIPSLFKLVKENKESINKPVLVKTGIKAYFEPDEVMYLYNRSSGPSKSPIKNLSIIYNSISLKFCRMRRSLANLEQLMAMPPRALTTCASTLRL